MDHIVYAQVFGLTAVALSVGIFMNLSHTKKMAREMIFSSVGYLLGGILPTVWGAWMITQHNVWTGLWPTAITLLGWGIFLLGIFRLWFAKAWMSILEENVEFLPSLFALFGLILGLLMCYIGFVAHTF